LKIVIVVVGRKEKIRRTFGFPKDINLCLMWLQQIEYGQSINAKTVNLKTGNIMYSYEIDINIIHVTCIVIFTYIYLLKFI